MSWYILLIDTNCGTVGDFALAEDLAHISISAHISSVNVFWNLRYTNQFLRYLSPHFIPLCNMFQYDNEGVDMMGLLCWCLKSVGGNLFPAASIPTVDLKHEQNLPVKNLPGPNYKWVDLFSGNKYSQVYFMLWIKPEFCISVPCNY